MSIRKLQNTIMRLGEGPLGGIVLGLFLIGALLVFLFLNHRDVPFIYQQF